MSEGPVARIDPSALETLLSAEACAVEPDAGCSEVVAASTDEVDLSAQLTQRTEKARQALAAAHPDLSVEERLLHELVLGEHRFFTVLEELQHRLACKLLSLIDDPRTGRAVAAVMRDVAAATNVAARRVEGALAVAVSLRAQQQLLRAHRGGTNET